VLACSCCVGFLSKVPVQPSAMALPLHLSLSPLSLYSLSHVCTERERERERASMEVAGACRLCRLALMTDGT
jgi:hypothetical protein